MLTEKTYRGENPQAMPALKEHYSDAQIVEITMVSCTFNFWNRFTDSLQIDIEEAPVIPTAGIIDLYEPILSIRWT